MTTETQLATSEDGTTIAYDTAGSGPVVVLVGAALSDRKDHRRLQRRLGERVRCVNYDRRGRGSSAAGDADDGDGEVQREVSDLAAVIEATGGAATVFGSSSGAVLALRAAQALGPAISRVVAYEPPLILDDSRPPVPADADTQIAGLLAEGRNAAAVRYFFGTIMGIPRMGVLAMRLMPGWSRSVRMAATLTNDLAVMEGLQAGTPLAPRSWAEVAVPTLILTGSKSERFFHDAASSLAAELPEAEARVLPGLHHGSAVMGSAALADAIVEFTHAAGTEGP
jgi:pimeloyl-ACP methyl ester carboxylesterase